MVITITGSREFDLRDILKVFSTLKKHCGKKNIWLIGGAKGIDNIALIYLLEQKERIEIVVPFKVVDQPQECQGNINLVRSIIEMKQKMGSPKEIAFSCIRRNYYMVDRSDLIIGFHNGISRGTKSTIDYANKKGKKVTVINVRKGD